MGSGSRACTRTASSRASWTGRCFVATGGPTGPPIRPIRRRTSPDPAAAGCPGGAGTSRGPRVSIARRDHRPRDHRGSDAALLPGDRSDRVRPPAPRVPMAGPRGAHPGRGLVGAPGRLPHVLLDRERSDDRRAGDGSPGDRSRAAGGCAAPERSCERSSAPRSLSGWCGVPSTVAAAPSTTSSSAHRSRTTGSRPARDPARSAGSASVDLGESGGRRRSRVYSPAARRR